MQHRWRRVLIVLGVLPVFIVLIAMAYAAGMEQFEGKTRTFWDALEWTTETLTSTGYGDDSHWDHPFMVLFVTAVQFAGLSVVFILLPYALLPFFEAYFEQRLPTQLPKLNDFVLVYRYGPAVHTLIEALDHHGIATVFFEEDETIARRLRDRKRHVVLGRFTEDDLDLKGLSRARAIIGNGPDHENAFMVVSVRQHGYTGPVHVLVETPSHMRPMELVGATKAYTPRHVLGAALAAHASDRIAPRVGGMRHLGEYLDIAELRIKHGSELIGKTLAEAHIRAKTGATVLGHRGPNSFTPLPDADTVLEDGALILAVGSSEAIKKLGRLAKPLPRNGPFLVLGYGEVGRTVTEMLRDVGEQVRVVEREDRIGVDVVGDAMDADVLSRAGIQDSKAVILALNSGPTLLVASMIRDLAPNVPLIARVNGADNANRVRQAGADFALSVSEVAGHILARQLLGEDSIFLENDLKITRVNASGLAGKTPKDAAVARRTQCALVAVERGDQIVVDLGGGFTLHEDDTLYICGSNEAVDRYLEVFPQNL